MCFLKYVFGSDLKREGVPGLSWKQEQRNNLVLLKQKVKATPIKNNAWMSVPQFGGWDQKGPGATDYSMVFSRARENRKQQKTDARRSLGNEQEFIAASLPQQRQEDEDSITKRKKILTYINCCIRP
ncbi:uncharacterized protein LOC111301177 isoform X3 [Durio zibethinus]|uniref:Uncharacterized protein LOC111301177 isoform X3 n=1 Tax=Durio zibethinus TaxID=66656 RepID=A0A6P5ZHP6_DURZI|nr:uncharacterized protein LOC111301177 isoform X3 [Durio zibethinus]